MNDNKTNVININAITRLNVNSENILLNSVGKVKDVIVIGRDKNDDSLYFASSQADGGDVLWLLELAKKALMEV